MYIYIYLHIHAVLFNLGAFYIAFKNTAVLVSSRSQFWRTKTAFSPGVSLFSRQNLTLKITTFWRTPDAFQNGALMLRNISAPFSNAYTHPTFVLLPSFSPLIRFIPTFAKPLIFVGFSYYPGSMGGTPQNQHAYISASRQDKQKTKNVNKDGSLIVGTCAPLKSLLLQCLPRKIENGRLFWPWRCISLKQQNSHKEPSPSTAAPVFTQNTPVIRKPKNIFDSSLMAIRPLDTVPKKRQAATPHGKTRGQVHEVEEAAWGQSNEEMTIPRWRRKNWKQQKQTETPKKTKQAETQNKNTNRKDKQSKECRNNKRVGPKEGSFPYTKTTK